MTSLKPTIKRPCGEDPEKMLAVDGGLHCERCNHIVIDFRSWSDNDIYAYLKDHGENKTCGIFHNTQLREKTSLKESLLKPWRYAAAAAVAFFASSLEVSAQVKVIEASTSSTAVMNDSVIWKISGKVHAPHEDRNGKTFEKKNINGVVVKAVNPEGQEVGTALVMNGNFDLIIYGTRNEKFELLFSNVRYHDYRISDFSPDGQSTLDVKLRPLRKYRKVKNFPIRSVGCPSF